MYLEATIENSDEIIYGDYPSLEGLEIGTKIPLSKVSPKNSQIIGEYEILSSELAERKNVTQVDPTKVGRMIKLTLRKIS